MRAFITAIANCRNVIPQLRGWDDKYRAAGLTIVGVHSPEFFWEKPYEKVVSATLADDVAGGSAGDRALSTHRRGRVR